MIQLHNDEKIVKVFEVKKSMHGKGRFYITNYGVCFESQKYGIVIKTDFELLKSYKVIKKDVFQIVWNTQNDDRFRYEMMVDHVEEVMIAYREINEEYAKAITEIKGLKSSIGLRIKKEKST